MRHGSDLLAMADDERKRRMEERQKIGTEIMLHAQADEAKAAFRELDLPTSPPRCRQIMFRFNIARVRWIGMDGPYGTGHECWRVDFLDGSTVLLSGEEANKR